MPKFIPYLISVDYSLLDGSAAECFLLDSSLPEDFVRSFARRASEQNKLVLAAGEKAADLCRRCNLDGVLLDLSNADNPAREIENFRKSAGKEKILGVISRNRRHEAMIISESEPDFVAFKIWKAGEAGTQELVRWYSELFLIQSAVFVQDEDAGWEACNSDIVIINESWYKILVAKNKSLD